MSGHAVVIGAGAMGRGIAQVLAHAGLPVALLDAKHERAEAARLEVNAHFERQVAKQKASPEDAKRVAELLRAEVDLETACHGAELVIEAVFEDINLKVELLSRAKKAAPADCLLASNTSSLSITEIGARVGASDRVIGLHFFNPPPVMALLEVVRGIATSEQTLERALGYAARWRKTPIVVQDTPGFATSRLGVLLGAEAIRMLETRVASVEDIDRAMELGYRHPMGPLKLTDMVGLDVRLAILNHLHRELGEQFRPPPLLRTLVRAGDCGKKTGAGFYIWKDGEAVARRF